MTVFNSPGMGTYGSLWQAHGYSGSGDVACLINSATGRPAVVCGSAAGVFEKLEFVRRKFADDDLLIFGVNDVGMYLPRMDHWVSLHGANLAAWKNVRWLHHRGPEDVRYHCIDSKDEADFHWELLNPLFALSGYFAMQIAWIMGCKPIILVGCPGQSVRRFFEADARPDFGYGLGTSGSDLGIRQQLIAEMNRLPEFKKVVKGTTGWTREFFGSL